MERIEFTIKGLKGYKGLNTIKFFLKTVKVGGGGSCVINDVYLPVYNKNVAAS